MMDGRTETKNIFSILFVSMKRCQTITLFGRSLRFSICRGSMPNWRAITPRLAARRLIRC